MLGIQLAHAQNVKITGTVTGSDDGMPLPGVSVVIKGTTIGTATNIDGLYELNVPTSATTLEFSFIGYETTTVEIAGRTVVDVAIASASEQIEEVMVVAYGVAKKESFTGSADVISSKKLEKRTASNITKAIDGLAAGIQTTSGGGQPGSSSSVIIRGFGSISASNDPLYVVDGIPFDGSLSSINPADIESMSVLKDASASALYGSRAANGVVIITTKKGKEGNLNLTFKGTWGVSSRALPRYETLDEAGYIETVFHSYRAQIYNDYAAEYGFTMNDCAQGAIQDMLYGDFAGLDQIFGQNEQYNPFDMPVSQLIDPATGKVNPKAKLRYSQDWMDEATAKNPLRQEYVLAANGGDEKTKYMFSLGYLDEEGLLATTEYKRFSARTNIESQLHNNIKSGLSLSYSNSKSNFTSTGSSTSNVFNSAQMMAPIYPVYMLDANGKTMHDANGKALYDYGDYRPSGAQSNFNSIATLFDDKYETIGDNLSGRTFAEIGDFKNALKGLNFRVTYGMDFSNTNKMVYYNPYFGNSAAIKGQLSKDYGRMYSYTTNQILTYDREFGDHHINVLAGHEFYKYTYNYMGGSKSGFPVGGLYEFDAATNISELSSYESNYAIQSYLSKIDYDFMNKYYLSASFRTDGSSRFKKEDRWGKFWSVGASWRISDESFMQDIEWLDNMTIKASYGVNGNDNIGSLYAWQELYDLSYANATLPGAIVSTLENTELTWEKNNTTNIGVEARMLNGRLSASVEWYNRKTTDLLLAYPMPVSSGFSSYYRNVGEMKNVGLDFSITGILMQSDDLTWSVSLLGSTVKNEVTSLYDRPEIKTGNYIIKEGETLNSFYLPVSAGVDPATGDQLFKVWDENGSELDPTSDIAVASQNKRIAGSRMPDVYGSLSTELRYKGFDFSVLTSYSIGGYINDGVYRGMLYASYIGNAIHKDRANAWKYPGDITDIPRLQSGGKTYLTTDKDLINASYFSIKNITLGYTFPEKWMNTVKLESIRVFATADNVVLFSHLKGMDPQYNFTGSTDYGYTPSRIVSLGIDVKF